jgi:hypothetical protein
VGAIKLISSGVAVAASGTVSTAVAVGEGAGAWQELAARMQSNEKIARLAMLTGLDMPRMRFMACE